MAEDCDDRVFPLAMNCIDRLLIQLSPRIRPSQFQLVGAVCLFIASKLRDCSESVSLSAKKLAEYSDFTFTSRQLIVRSHLLHYDRSTLYRRMIHVYNTHGQLQQSHIRYSRVREPFLVIMYTVNHKKRDILFLTITLANLNRFL